MPKNPTKKLIGKTIAQHMEEFRKTLTKINVSPHGSEADMF
jgi:hypothetical protein